NARAEILSSNVLDLVRFVEYNRRILRQDGSVVSVSQREIGEEQVMVYDDDVCIQGFATHSSDKTNVEIRTALAKTGLCTRVNLRPESEAFGQIGELRPVTGLALRRPLADSLEVVDVFKAFKHWSLGRLLQAMQTHVIRPAFHANGFERGRRDLLKKWDVLLVELFL